MATPDRSWLRKWSIASTVPMLLVAGIVLGYLAGQWLDRRFGWAPWGLMGGLLLGLAAGAREAWRALQQLQPPSEPQRADAKDNERSSHD